MIKPPLILLTGFAKSGKDTFFRLLNQKYPDIFTRYAFADQLKIDLKDLLFDKCGIDIFNLSSEVKEIVRPLMVAYGCMQRNLGDGLYWVNKLSEKISNNDNNIVICDCRFPNEAKFFKENYNCLIVKITKLVNGAEIAPPNEEEARNQPLVDLYVDWEVKWPESKDDELLTKYVVDFMERKKIL